MKKILLICLGMALILGASVCAQAANPNPSDADIRLAARVDLLHYFYSPHSLKTGMLLSDITVTSVVVGESGGVPNTPRIYIIELTLKNEQGERHFKMTLSNLTTNDQGKITGYTQEVQDSGYSPGGRTMGMTKSIEYGADGKTLSKVIVNGYYKNSAGTKVGDFNYTYSNYTYDANGRVTSYKAAGKEANGTQYSWKVTIDERDAQGRTVKWTLVGRQNGHSLNYTHTNSAWDDKGRVMKWTVKGKIAGVDFDYTCEVVRNALGHITQSTYTYRNTAGQIGTVIVYSGIEYDSYGLQAKYHLKITVGNTVTSDYDVTILTRDAANRAASWREKGKKNGIEIDLTTTIIDRFADGSQKKWEVRGMRAGKTYLEVREILERDSENRVKKETIVYTIDGKTTKYGYWDYTYNADGRCTSYKLKLVNPDGRVTWYKYELQANGTWKRTEITAPTTDPFLPVHILTAAVKEEKKEAVKEVKKEEGQVIQLKIQEGKKPVLSSSTLGGIKIVPQMGGAKRDEILPIAK